MSTPLDVFGNPVKHTAAVGPGRKVYHRAPRASTSMASLEPTYLERAQRGEFRKKSMGIGWTEHSLIFDGSSGPTLSTQYLARARAREEAALTSLPIYDDAGSPHIRSNRRVVANDGATMMREVLPALREKERNGGRLADVTAAMLLHSEDEAYVDTYREFVRDRRHRQVLRQARAFYELPSFAVNPLTKLRTLPKRQDALAAVAKGEFDPRAHRVPRRAQRANVEQEEISADIVNFEAGVFEECLRKLGLVDATGTAIPASNALPQSRGTLSTVSELQEVVSKTPWATVAEGKSYPFQRQLALRRQADEANLKRAFHKAMSAIPEAELQHLSARKLPNGNLRKPV